MKTNTHNLDRIARVILAVILFVAALATQQWLIALPGVIFLGTAAVGFCPLYAIFGISTCPVQPQTKA